MIFQEQMTQDQDRIKYLVNKIHELERSIESQHHYILDLQGQIRILEQTTARECLGGDISKGMDTDLPPEKRSPIKASRKRIKAATNLFDKNFDPEGHPTTDLGKKLTGRYGGIANG